jgi:hypothetical protein
VIDLFMSKTAANREKDRVFNMALLQHGYVNPKSALEMVQNMHRLSDTEKDQGFEIPTA